MRDDDNYLYQIYWNSVHRLPGTNIYDDHDDIRVDIYDFIIRMTKEEKEHDVAVLRVHNTTNNRHTTEARPTRFEQTRAPYGIQ